MKSILLALTIPVLLIVCSCHRQAARATAPLPSVAARAIGESQLTLAGSKPFHLKAIVVEATNLENDSYKAEIEEYWVAPDKWRRMVKAPGFSSDIVVNGDKQSESATGDYYPNWLRTLVTAIFDPGAPIRHVDFTVPSDNPMPGSDLLCRRYSSRIGIPPAQNSIFSTVCFDGDRLESVQLPGYDAEYKNYKDFDRKQVARAIREYIEPGTELEATITELTELTPVDESMFAVTQPASPALQTVTLGEDMLRKLANDPLEPRWPPTKGGKTEGTLSVYVCLDRAGKVRETYALNSDNAGMSEATQRQLSGIQFTPPKSNDKPVQVEGILTFAYKTVISDPYPELTDEQARERLVTSAEFRFPPSVPKGTVVTASVLVGEDGKVAGSGAFMGLPAQVGSLAPDFEGWIFRPLIKNGKPTAFTVVLKFVVR